MGVVVVRSSSIIRFLFCSVGYMTTIDGPLRYTFALDFLTTVKTSAGIREYFSIMYLGRSCEETRSMFVFSARKCLSKVIIGLSTTLRRLGTNSLLLYLDRYWNVYQPTFKCLQDGVPQIKTSLKTFVRYLASTSLLRSSVHWRSSSSVRFHWRMRRL